MQKNANWFLGFRTLSSSTLHVEVWKSTILASGVEVWKRKVEENTQSLPFSLFNTNSGVILTPRSSSKLISRGVGVKPAGSSSADCRKRISKFLIQTRRLRSFPRPPSNGFTGRKGFVPGIWANRQIFISSSVYCHAGRLAENCSDIYTWHVVTNNSQTAELREHKCPLLWSQVWQNEDETLKLHRK